MSEQIEFHSIKKCLPKMFKCCKGRYRTLPILLQLNYHWWEETHIVLGYLNREHSSFRPGNYYWYAESAPGWESIPLESIIAWAYLPEGLGDDNPDYIWEWEREKILKDDDLERLWMEREESRKVEV